MMFIIFAFQPRSLFWEGFKRDCAEVRLTGLRAEHRIELCLTPETYMSQKHVTCMGGMHVRNIFTDNTEVIMVQCAALYFDGILSQRIKTR